MTNTILLSNASLERKEEAEFLLFARDIRNASRIHGILPKEGTETDYWELIDMQYWEQFRFRFDTHISKYADLENLGDRAKDFLKLLKSRSPAMAEDFWKHFFQTTDRNNPLSDKAGIKALHKVAEEQLETLVVESGAKTLDMKFTAIDGTTIDLTKMRGKVILIDFWASWCSPCIAEIPHVKAMYDKYHKQGFEVIGIAMDEDSAKKRVQEILKKNKALWPQRFEGKGFSGDSYGLLYGINSLPTVWLIDKEGRIVDRNARGEKLEPLIRKYLGL
jgi:thiol-disulfide isomerase/thioredoxin